MRRAAIGERGRAVTTMMHFCLARDCACAHRRQQQKVKWPLSEINKDCIESK